MEETTVQVGKAGQSRGASSVRVRSGMWVELGGEVVLTAVVITDIVDQLLAKCQVPF